MQMYKNLQRRGELPARSPSRCCMRCCGCGCGAGVRSVCMGCVVVFLQTSFNCAVILYSRYRSCCG